MAELSNMKDTWNVLAVKPKYHTYVVVIGESARRDAMGAFGGHWDNTPFASSVKGTLFTDYVAASGSTQKSLGLTLNRVVDGKPQYQDNLSPWQTARVSDMVVLQSGANWRIRYGHRQHRQTC
jgi:glucan phosphoethanolaminetransferase (alkaline phosphatase superfamily)